MMKCKECRDFKQCLYEANRLEQIFDPDYEWADCFAPISNADCIRNMSDEELEDEIRKIAIGYEPWCDRHCKMNGDANCNVCLAKWLKQPHKENTDD